MNAKPAVVFMVPSERPDDYAIFMNQLTIDVQEDLRLPSGSIELIGLVAATAEHGAEGIFFLDEMGVETRSLTLLVLWGETAASVNFEDTVPENCGVGTVILPATGVVLPTVRMPSLDGDWWHDPLHRAYATVTYAGLVRNGTAELEGSEPFVFVACPYTWN